VSCDRLVTRVLQVGAPAVALALLAAGCTVGRYYTGVPLRNEPAAIVEGQSTRGDVLRLFGPPDQIMQYGAGDAFVYAYEQQNYSSLRVQDPIVRFTWFTYTRTLSQRDRLVVLFDLRGVVTGVSIDHHTEELPVL